MTEKQFYRRLIAAIERVYLSFKNRHYKSDDSVLEAVIFTNTHGKQVAMPYSNEHLGSSFTSKGAFAFFAIIIFCFSIGLTRMFGLQIVHGSTYRQLAESNRQRRLPIIAERGEIFDRHGIPLTKNIPSFSIILVPQDIPRDEDTTEKVAERLALLSDKSTPEILDLIDKYRPYTYESIVIEDNIEYEAALSILIDAANLPGVGILQGNKRLYLHSDPTSSTQAMSLAHIIGYLGKIAPEDTATFRDRGYLISDSHGQTGVEAVYEEFLHGRYGNRLIEVDAVGREQAILAEEPPIPGHHLNLAIDIHIQSTLENLLREKLSELGQTRGSAVAVEPNTGKILALVSLPTFDNNDFSGGIDEIIYRTYLEDETKPLFNRAIAGIYPSGSTVKPAIAAAALEEGVITPFTQVQSTGGLQVGAWFFPDWREGGHGLTNVRNSLAWSINTFYYVIGGGHTDFSITPLGPARIAYYLYRFGLGRRLGIDLPGEVSGLIPTKEWKDLIKDEPWYTGDTYNLSIGQGDLLVTPLQIAMLTASIANGGTLLKPQIVDGIVDPLTGEVDSLKPHVIEDGFVDASHMGTIRRGMRDCVVYGSCRRLASVPVNIAGKTGTAQWHSVREPHAWFTSFAPFENPEIVLTILIEEGKGGSESAIPVADEFYRWWWQYIRN